MTYRPKPKNSAAAFLSGASAVFAVASFYSSSRVEMYNGFYQLAAVIFAIIALQVFLKYVQSDYIYEAGEHDLKIYKVTGNKSVCVCSLSYEESISCAVKSDYYKQHKNKYPKNKISLNYCKSIFPSDYSVYFFNFNSKTAVLKFEPDEVFSKYLNEKITHVISEKEKEENGNESESK